MKFVYLILFLIGAVALASAPSWSTVLAHRVTLTQSQLAVSQDNYLLLKNPTQLQTDSYNALAPNSQVQIDRINATPSPSPSSAGN